MNSKRQRAMALLDRKGWLNRLNGQPVDSRINNVVTCLDIHGVQDIELQENKCQLYPSNRDRFKKWYKIGQRGHDRAFLWLCVKDSKK